jgi:Tol biopolymer transport system component
MICFLSSFHQHQAGKEAQSMAFKHLRLVPLFLIMAALCLSACSGEQATSTVEATLPPAEETAPPADDSGLRPLTVTSVTVEIDLGSLIPVDAVVNGEWPDPCAQLARIDQQVNGGSFEINLLASPADPDCPTDAAGIPFRIAVPLNMVALAPGSYSVAANGVSTTFEWDPAGAQPPSGEPPGGNLTIAYVGPDGNIWALDSPDGAARQLTADADAGPMDGSAPTTPIISYYFPAISSDGSLVAFRRDLGTPAESSMDFTFGLWVYDLRSGETVQVVDRNPAGFAWKPGTHLLAYGTGVDEGYFPIRGGTPEADLATGLRGFDFDTRETVDLVQPERGLALYTPVWSPDGRFLAFNELTHYEGMGNFGYYDFEAQEYIGWDEPIGLHDWSPDAEQIAYDYLTYTATGTERIFIRPRQGGEEVQVSPDFENSGYAFHPVFSPQGNRIAYLANLEGPDSQNHTLFVQDLAGGEPRQLGNFESAFSLSWTPDGSHLVLSAGPWDSQEIVMVDVDAGTSAILAPGTQPAVSGQ